MQFLLALVLLFLFRPRPEEKSQDHHPIGRLRQQVEEALEALTDEELDAQQRDQLDEVFSRVNKVSYYANYAKVAVGFGLLLHGGEVGTTILFSQTLKEVGGPQLVAAAEDLGERWRAASEAAAAEAPTFRKMRDKLKKLEKEANDVLLALLDLDDDEKAKRALSKELSELSFAAYRCRDGATSIRRVVEALDPAAVRRIAGSAWTAFAACAATAHSNAISGVSLGLGAGGDIYETALKNLVEPAVEALRSDEILPKPIKSWADATVKSTTQAAFVLTALNKRQLTTTLNAATLGSRLVIEGLRPTAPPVLSAAIADDSPVLPAFTATLVALGLSVQLSRPLARPLFLQPARLPLVPLFVLEKGLDRLAANTKVIAAAAKAKQGITNR